MIGTVYKEMKLKPNILDEYVKVALVTWASASIFDNGTCDRIYSRACSAVSFRTWTEAAFQLSTG